MLETIVVGLMSALPFAIFVVMVMIIKYFWQKYGKTKIK